MRWSQVPRPRWSEAHGTFGLHFGRAFQHVDDLLDLVGDAGRMGKPARADASNGVPTAVSLRSGEDALEVVARLVCGELERARSALADDPRATGALGDWATTALRRAVRSAVDPDDLDLAARLAAAFGPLELASDPRAWEMPSWHTSSTG